MIEFQIRHYKKIGMSQLAWLASQSYIAIGMFNRKTNNERNIVWCIDTSPIPIDNTNTAANNNNNIVIKHTNNWFNSTKIYKLYKFQWYFFVGFYLYFACKMPDDDLKAFS